MTEFKSLCLAEVALVLVVAEDRDPPMDVLAPGHRDVSPRLLEVVVDQDL